MNFGESIQIKFFVKTWELIACSETFNFPVIQSKLTHSFSNKLLNLTQAQTSDGHDGRQKGFPWMEEESYSKRC